MTESLPTQGLPSYTPADVTRDIWDTLQQLRKSTETALVGSFVRVMSDHNGQPFGRSHKSWNGEVARIKSVHIDLYNGISLELESHDQGGECYIPANEVEFI